jgi:hypothetical protein
MISVSIEQANKLLAAQSTTYISIYIFEILTEEKKENIQVRITETEKEKNMKTI